MRFATGSSNGSVVLFEATQSAIRSLGSASAAHTGDVTCVAQQGGQGGSWQVASVGEDGAVLIHPVDSLGSSTVLGTNSEMVANPDFTHSSQGTDAHVLHTACFAGSGQLLTGNAVGMMTLFVPPSPHLILASDAMSPVRYDARQSGAAGVWQEGSGMGEPLLTLSPHPARPHAVLSGSAAGVLCAWDLRSPRWPIARMRAGDTPLWAVAHHPRQPDRVLTADGAGALLRWAWDPASASGAAPVVRSVWQGQRGLRAVDVVGDGDAVVAVGPQQGVLAWQAAAGDV
jgi:WD40 repeat protein